MRKKVRQLERQLKQARSAFSRATRNDETERKRAEEILRKRQEEYRTLFESVPVGLYRTTPDGRILLANKAIIKMLGYSSFEGLKTRNLEKGGFEPEYPRTWFKELVEKEGRVLGLESAWLTQDGKTRYVREGAVAVRDEQGRIVYYEGIIEDITEQKLAEAALKESERLYRLLLDNVPVGIYRADPDGRLLMANPAFVRILGYSSFEELQAHNRGLAGGGPGLSSSQLSELLRKGQRGTWQETMWEMPGRVYLWLRQSGTAVRDGDGKIKYYEGIVEDVSDQKLAEELLRQAHAKLVSARDQERRRLATELHDSLGQALIALQLSLKGTIATYRDSADAGLIERCAQAAESCASLARNIREMSHGLYPPTLDSLGLMASLRELVKVCQQSGVAAEVRWCKALEGRRMPADVEISLFRIAQEAVANSLRHGRAKHVRLALEHLDGWVTFSVVDDGVGFDTHSVPPHGLGLNSMKERTAAIGGVLQIDSAPGRTRVAITAPAELRKESTPRTVRGLHKAR